MALLRTKRLAAHVTSSTGAETVYTCPTGFRAVVRDISSANFGGAAVTRLIVALVPSGGSDVDRIQVQPIAVDEVAHWTGELVLEPGDQLICIASTATCTIVVSGAELMLPS